MARRTLSAQDIKLGMAYIHSKLVDQKMSSRDVVKDPNLPFSLTTYYKYLPKYEKRLNKAPESIIDDNRTPTQAIAENKTKDNELLAENQQLKEELNLLSRFIVKKYISSDIGAQNENGNSNQGIH